MSSDRTTVLRTELVGDARDYAKAMNDAGEKTDEYRAKVRTLNELKLEEKKLKIDDNIAEAEKRVQSLKQHNDDLAASGGGIKAKLGDAFGDLTARMGPAGDALNSLVGSSAGAAAALGGAGIAVAALATFVKNGVADFTHLADEVRRVSSETGLAAEDASRMVAAFDDVGISADKGAAALSAMTRNLDSKKFGDLGIEIRKTKDGAVDFTQTFLGVVDAYDKASTPIEKANIASAAFGKTYTDLLPLLDRGAAGVKALFAGNEKSGQILSQKDLDTIKAFHEVMDGLGDGVRRFSLEAGKIALPVLKVAAEDAGKLVEGLHKGVEAVVNVAEKFRFLEPVAKAVGAVFLTLPVTLHQLANISFDTIENGLQKMINLADKIAGPFVNFPDDVFHNKQGKIAGAMDLATDSAKKMEQQIGEKLAAATAEQAKKAEEAAAANEKLEKAARGMYEATLQAPEKTKAAADSAKAWADAMAEASKAQEQVKATDPGPGPAQQALERAKAAREHEQATNELAKAKAAERDATVDGARAIAEAEAKVADIRKDAPRLARDVADAKQALADQTQVVAEKVDAEREAQTRYDQVIGRLPPSIKEVNDAQRAQLEIRERLAGLTDDLSAAEGSLADAKAALADAEKNLPLEAANQLAELRIRSAEGTEKLAESERKLADAKSAGKSGAELVDLERGVVEARIARDRANVALERGERELSDLSDEMAEKQRAVSSAERNVERIRRDKADATTEESKATKTLTEVTEGSVKGSERETKAKADLVKAQKDRHDATTKEKDLSETLSKALAAQAELPGKIADAIAKLRDVETDTSGKRKAAHETVTKVIDDQRLKSLEHAADVEKAAAKREAAEEKTSKKTQDLFALARKAIDDEVAARINHAEQAGRSLSLIEEAQIRAQVSEEKRRTALAAGHKEVADQIKAQTDQISVWANGSYKMTMTADNTDANTKAADTKGKLLDVHGTVVNPALKADNSDANAKAADTSGKMTALHQQAVNTQVRADNSDANAKAGDTKGLFDALHGRIVQATLAATDSASSSINTVAGKLRSDIERTYSSTMSAAKEYSFDGNVSSAKQLLDGIGDRTSTIRSAHDSSFGGNVSSAKLVLDGITDRTSTIKAADGLNKGDANAPINYVKREIDSAGADRTAKLTLHAEVTKADQLKNYLEAINTYALQLGQYHQQLAAGTMNLRPPVVPTPGAFGLNAGGLVPGFGPDRDSVLAALTPGEFVMRRAAVERVGVPTLDAINRGAGTAVADREPSITIGSIEIHLDATEHSIDARRMAAELVPAIHEELIRFRRMNGLAGTRL